MNIIADSVARQYRLHRSQNNDLQIRIATGTVVPISYYTQFNLTIAGVTANIRAYILPMRTSYTLLLGRRWMNQVGLMGDYRRGSYEMEEEDGTRIKVPECGNEKRTNGPCKVEIVLQKERSDLQLPEEEIEEFAKINEESWLSEATNRALDKVMGQSAIQMESVSEGEGGSEEENGIEYGMGSESTYEYESWEDSDDESRDDEEGKVREY